MNQSENDDLVRSEEREAIAQYVEVWMRAYSKGSIPRLGSVEAIGEALATAIRDRHENPPPSSQKTE